MTAQTLRDAAKVLRERADKATPGIWKVWGMSVMADTGGNSNVDEATDVAQTHFRNEQGRSRTFDADYIATMHPGVGLALADWLDDEAPRADYREDQQRHANATRLRAEPFACYYDKSTEHALVVARAILGSDA